MVVNILKTSKPIAIVTFSIFCVLFFAGLFFYDFSFSFSKSGYPLYDLLIVLTFNKVWLTKLITILLILLLSMGWNNLIYDKFILSVSSVLPASFVLIISLFFPFSPVWPVTFLLLFFLNNLLSIFQVDKPYISLFDAGLLLGFCFLFYPPSIVFLITLFAANFIYGSISWRCFVIPSVAFILPFILYLAYLFCFSSIDSVIDHYINSIGLSVPTIILPNYSVPFVLISLFIFLFSLMELIKWLPKKSLKSRKAFILLFTFSFSVFLSFFIQSNEGWSNALLFVLPFSVLCSNYFLFAQKKWWYESLYALILISAFYFLIRRIVAF